MPELPEVELVARYLRPRLVGRCIQAVETTAQSYFFLTSPSVLRRRLPGETIHALDRHGKYLLLELSSHCRLLLHLGMTGQLMIAGKKQPRLAREQRRATRDAAAPRGTSRSGKDHTALADATSIPFERDAHTHLVLEFADGGAALYFRDARKFGKVRLLEPGTSDPRLDKLGPDALKVTAELLFDASRKRRIEVKSLLLDQSVLAGVGNIYADESLYLAGIHPTRSAVALTREDCANLAKVVRRVLRYSISHGGSSIDDYVHPDGSSGEF
ncbi:MAG TPA: bifunctional DNA-formamidopyrimidine glycosylase/DNA-(apurinic or apyrimidinic site) lyase, partial [Polyangiaceae bacterium]